MPRESTERSCSSKARTQSGRRRLEAAGSRRRRRWREQRGRARRPQPHSRMRPGPPPHREHRDQVAWRSPHAPRACDRRVEINFNMCATSPSVSLSERWPDARAVDGLTLLLAVMGGGPADGRAARAATSTRSDMSRARCPLRCPPTPTRSATIISWLRFSARTRLGRLQTHWPHGFCRLGLLIAALRRDTRNDRRQRRKTAVLP
jgi:hypothetical protein